MSDSGLKNRINKEEEFQRERDKGTECLVPPVGRPSSAGASSCCLEDPRPGSDVLFILFPWFRLQNGCSGKETWTGK